MGVISLFLTHPLPLPSREGNIDECSLLFALRSTLFLLSVHKHEAIQILGFTFVTEGLDRESVIPGCLIDIDPAGLHGRPGPGSEITG